MTRKDILWQISFTNNKYNKRKDILFWIKLYIKLKPNLMQASDHEACIDRSWSLTEQRGERAEVSEDALPVLVPPPGLVGGRGAATQLS